MVTQELIDLIKEKYQEGANRQKIKDELAELGWQETDVDAAIRQIQHEALQKLPIVSHINQFMTQLDTKTSAWSVPVVLGACGVMALVVIAIAIFLYNTVDPLGNNAASRDSQREKAMNVLHDAIDAYYKTNSRYPGSLSDLAPSFIASIPTDPKTGQQYDYMVKDNSANYELCAQFETLSVQCVSSSANSTIPFVTPTEALPSSAQISGAPGSYSPQTQSVSR